MLERAGTEQRRERSELDPRFGKVGISAVAAAMRYRGEQKNQAYAPAARNGGEHTEEAAA
jgi:hypothetical protein